MKQEHQTQYTVHELAALAGVSARTLRYYDEIGLLAPARVGANGYRLYGPVQVAALQQILFYRALGVELKAIPPLLAADKAHQAAALQQQLKKLQARQRRMAALADTLQKTILELKGAYHMKDSERFAALKQQMLEENEAQYGPETRAAYGDAAVEAANARLASWDEAEWQQVQALNRELAALLQAQCAAPTPANAAALADTHRRWLCHYWPAGTYTPAAHRGMAQLYRADARFAAYYNAIAPGGCEALCQAIERCV